MKGILSMPIKPTEKEEEYFARVELEKLKKIEMEKHKTLREGEKQKLKELHFMRCPKCGMEIIEVDYKGLNVDKCSECDGVWLDAGELEAVAKMDKSAIDKLFSIFTK
jgi:uncharacterized protein